VFRVRAANLHGWGNPSNEVPVVVSGIPSQPAAVTTEIIGEDVKITWVAPSPNYNTITAYELAIKDSSGTD